MKKIIWFASILFVSCAFSPNMKKKVIFFGDSITEQGVKEKPYKGYVLVVDSLCKAANKGEDFEFVGAGISGNKIYDLYLRMDEDVLQKNPSIVFIWIGVNDVWHKAFMGTGTDADKFEKFYNAILKKLKEENIKAVLVTPAVIGEKNDMSNQLDGDLNKYCNIIKGIASKNGLPLIDLRTTFIDYNKKHNPNNDDRGILTQDGVHLNAQGNKLVAEMMWKAVKSIN